MQSIQTKVSHEIDFTQFGCYRDHPPALEFTIRAFWHYHAISHLIFTVLLKMNFFRFILVEELLRPAWQNIVQEFYKVFE